MPKHLKHTPMDIYTNALVQLFSDIEAAVVNAGGLPQYDPRLLPCPIGEVYIGQTMVVSFPADNRAIRPRTVFYRGIVGPGIIGACDY